MIFMEKLDKIIACLRQMGMKPKVDNFQHKLIIQKTVCLFELMGMDLKYGYSLYVRGPYSPALAKEMHEQRGNVENLKTGCKLTAKEVETAEKVAEASDNLNPEMLEIPWATMEKWLNGNKEFDPYRFGIENLYRLQSHVLDAERSWQL